MGLDAMERGPGLGGQMHLIETMIGLSPDGGSGSLELAIFVAFIAAFAIFVRRARRGLYDEKL